jgi:dTDP-4-dehydrorhamnose 3,5-epimerase
MEILESPLPGVLLIKPLVFEDHRGYFMETYNQKIKELLPQVSFVQDNESQSGKFVARGLHFQRGAYAQAKLVRVIRGAVQDIIVDIRHNSPTYGQHYATILSEQNKHQLFVPKGFAHGFIVLEDHTIFSYKCDQAYHAQEDTGIQMNDEALGVQWAIPPTQWIQSPKDKNLLKLGSHER